MTSRVCATVRQCSLCVVYMSLVESSGRTSNCIHVTSHVIRHIIQMTRNELGFT